MNLQLDCLGKILEFEAVSDLTDLKVRLSTCEPSFVLETLTYLDEENDVITVSNDEDFSCLLSSTIATVQAIGKHDLNKEKMQKERSLLLQKKLKKKVEYFKQQQRLYLKNRRDQYQQKLDLIISGKKEIKELKIREKQLQQQIPEQQQIIKQNERIKIKVTPKQDLDKTTIYKDILEAESNIKYDEDSLNNFRKQMYQLEQVLCEKFGNAYQTRLDKFITLRQKRKNAIQKLEQLKVTLQELQKEIKSKTQTINRKEFYYTQKLMAVKSLLRKL